jgi:hypothetical protein
LLISRPATFNALGVTGQVSGDTARAEIQDAQLDAALDALRADRCRLISVNPVRGTLEEYFLKQMNAPTVSAAKRSSQK